MPIPKDWHCYILICSDKSLYTGITNDLEARVKAHNSSNRGAKYTKTRRPVELVWSLKCDDRSSAAKLEYKIKIMKRLDKEKVIRDEKSVEQMRNEFKKR